MVQVQCTSVPFTNARSKSGTFNNRHSVDMIHYLLNTNTSDTRCVRKFEGQMQRASIKSKTSINKVGNTRDNQTQP